MRTGREKRGNGNQERWQKMPAHHLEHIEPSVASLIAMHDTVFPSHKAERKRAPRTRPDIPSRDGARRRGFLFSRCWNRQVALALASRFGTATTFGPRSWLPARPPVRRFLATSAEPTPVTDCPSFGRKVAQVPAEGAKRYMASRCRHGNKTAEDAGGMCRWNEAARTVVGAVCAQMRSFGKESRLAAPLVMRTSCCLPFVCVRAGVCAHPH